MNRLEQLFSKLGYSRENGLFYSHESELWIHKFPYRIGRVLRDIIQPYAFYSLYHNGDTTSEHPEPINNPLILFFNKPDDDKKSEIPKWTFCFGQAPIIIINSDDTKPIDIFHGYKFENTNNQLLQRINANTEDFSVVNLTLGRTWKKLYHDYFKNVDKVDKYLLNNIIDARRILIAKDGYSLEPKIANRLIGRLLFVRYLIDRKVIFKDQDFISGSNKIARQQSLNDLIRTKTKLFQFFNYLTQKYNGDLFPLTEEIVDQNNGEITEIYNEEKYVTKEHLNVLYHLFSASSFFKTGVGHQSGYVVQPSLFKVYDFEVIPVELISNIYENFIGKVDENINVRLSKLSNKSKQYEIKAYYTPPFIVDYILSQTITPFLEEKSTAYCKVLDPACGSGIFLVETLRKIVEKEISISQSKGEISKKGISNKRLWSLLHENIFGIDIDSDAIEITIFSLYITLLDYKTPIEIEDFKFEELKGRNLFGGELHDFFNEEADFNKLVHSDFEFDFIIGNPPWGKVKTSRYIEYIENRNIVEQAKFKATIVEKKYCELQIGNKEIAQAFLVRVSDFISKGSNTKCAFIVTGKCLYNTDDTTKQWREYFLSNNAISQVVELSCVNNKIVGGNQIFEGARQSAAIIFYHPIDYLAISKNIITHITVKPNRFFNYFRTIVIEKHDIKHVLQVHFMEKLGGHDWLWKVLLHGNVLDYYFMKRLKDSFDSFLVIMKKFNLDFKGGLKLKDGQARKSTSEIKNWSFLEIESRKELQPYNINSTSTWGKEVDNNVRLKTNKIHTNGEVGYLPDLYFFQGEKVLLKKGLQAADGFKAVAAYSRENIVFTSSVCSIKLQEGKDEKKGHTNLLKSLVGLFNSKLFTYYILNSSSSAGVDRTRAYFDEFFSFPIIFSKQISDIVDKIHILNNPNSSFRLGNDNLLKVNNLQDKLEDVINKLYEVSDTEKSLLDYAIDIAIPVLKRAEETGYRNINIFKKLDFAHDFDKKYLEDYANIFIDHFKYRFNSDEKYFYVEIFNTEDFIGIHFIVSKKPSEDNRIFFNITKQDIFLNQIGDLGIHSVTRDLYIQQDVRGFNKNTFYIIKPNEKKCWHKAVAHHDLMEFVEALANAEFKQAKHLQI